MKIKKWMITGYVCILTAAFLTGCGNNVENVEVSQEQTADREQMQGNEQSNVIIVTAINGNEITGKRMMHDSNQGNGMSEKPAGEAPTGEEAEMPEKPAGEAPTGEEAEMPEKPEGEAPTGENGEMPEKPEGEAPAREGGEMQSITFTITEETKITQESEDGTVDATVDDIQVDAMIQVELNDNNEAESIIIKEFQQNDSSDPKKQKESSEE